jgi:Ca2+-binding RTX toxin-like protein
MFEQLEARRLFTAALNAGLLSVTGTAGNDTILIGLNASGQVRVNDNSVISLFNAADVTSISVDAGNGNDNVTMQNLISKPAVIHGGAGNDMIQGGEGADKLYGDGGADVIRGFGGNDSIYAGTGNDTCFGGAGHDSIEGGTGSDYLYGDQGNDTVWGESRPIAIAFPFVPKDISKIARAKINFRVPITINKLALPKPLPTPIFGAVPGPSMLTTGAPTPIKPITTIVTPTLPVFEVLTYNDVIAGGAGNDELHGNIGNDIIFGHDGNDKLWGDAGNDDLYGGNHADEMFGGAGDDDLYGGAGNDSLVVVGGGVKDRVRGEAGFDQLWLDSNASETILSPDPAETIGGAVHRVGSFVGGVSKELNGQNLADPNANFNSYTGVYKNFASKPLFSVMGPSKNDIDQGGIGDCYYLAGLSGIAKQDPQRIRNNVVSFGDGTFGVRFYENSGAVCYYRVDADLPVANASSFTPRYADLGIGDSMWVAVMEKAFAHFRSGANSYASLHGGGMSEPFRALGTTAAGITNLWAGTQNATLNNIRNALLAGKAVSAGTPPVAPTNGAPAVGWHAYTVDSVQMSGGVPVSITLRNPWSTDGAGNDGVNDGYVTATAAQFYGYFNQAISAVV